MVLDSLLYATGLFMRMYCNQYTNIIMKLTGLFFFCLIAIISGTISRIWKIIFVCLDNHIYEEGNRLFKITLRSLRAEHRVTTRIKVSSIIKY